MWVEPSAHSPPRWRFSLENIDTGQRYGFADLDAFICHLLEQMEVPPDARQATGEVDQQTIGKPS